MCVCAIRNSGDHENNIGNPVVECPLSAFSYEHLVTTFTRLNIESVAFCMEHTAEIEEARQPVETFDFGEAKEGITSQKVFMRQPAVSALIQA